MPSHFTTEHTNRSRLLNSNIVSVGMMLSDPIMALRARNIDSQSWLSPIPSGNGIISASDKLLPLFLNSDLTLAMS